MKTIFDCWKQPAVFTTLAVIACTLLIMLGLINCLGKGDWPAWVGALGTVGAFVGTICLATASDRRRDREQLDLALIHAAQLSIWIRAVQGALSSSARVLDGSIFNRDPRKVFLHCGEILAAAGMWSSTDLAPLFVMPDHTAAKLAVIKVRIETTITSLRKTGAGAPFPPEEIGPYYHARRDDMAKEFEDLDALRQACEHFLNRHGVAV